MEPVALIRLCARPSSTVTSVIKAPRQCQSTFSALRRNLDRRRLNEGSTFRRQISSSTSLSQQQAAVQEPSEEDDYPPQFRPPIGTQRGRFRSPQPTPPDPSSTPLSQNNTSSASLQPPVSKYPDTLPSKRMHDWVAESNAPSNTAPSRPSSKHFPQPRPEENIKSKTLSGFMRSPAPDQSSPTRPPSSHNDPALALMSDSAINRDLPTPTSSPSYPSITRTVAANISMNPFHHDLDYTALRLKPSLGRSTEVNFSRGVDLQRAILTTDRKVKANNVRLDERRQKFHVRAGQRRKDLKSQRWRRLFKAGFRNEVAKIQMMRKQGW